MDNRITYRAEFEKTGSAKYISHLDLNRCMQRAIRRSGLPAWYTEGFHPHMYLMFALALSLGAESLCETMDFRLTQEIPVEEVKERLNAAMPAGLRVHDVRIPKHTAAEIGSALYRVELQTADAQALAGQWEAFLAQPELLVEKKTKRGMKQIDIKPQISVESLRKTEGILSIDLRLPAGNEANLNVSVVTGAFQNYAEQPFLINSAVRLKIFCLNGEEFS